MVEDIILLEGPETIAAILLEGYSGTSGIIQGGDEYWRGMQALKEKYGLLLIVDEVLSGFGRTGKWFGIDHYPWVRPDLMAMAKGLTGGYIPLGAVMMTDSIAGAFNDRPFHGGLTYSSHPIACAAGEAAVEAYQAEGLVEKARDLGVELRAGLIDLAEKHEMIGEIRGAGLHHVIELVRDRETRAPLSDFNAPLSAPVKAIAAGLRAAGMSTFVKWNMIFCAPPLVSGPAEIRAGLEIIDGVMEGVRFE
jgi:taurine--2-oxoglutarate transaminase